MKLITVTKTGKYEVEAFNTKTGVLSPKSSPVYVYSAKQIFCRLEDVFPNPRIYGFFKMLSESTTNLGKWLKEHFANEISSCDNEYIYNHSGKKLLSLLLLNNINGREIISDTAPLDNYTITVLCNTFNSRFFDKWQKLYETLNFDFDPLRPYQMQITDETNDKLDSTNNRNYSDKSNNGNKVYGFNSTEGVNNTEGDTSNSGDSKDTYSRTNGINRTVTRSGNIGNATQQHLVEEQRQMLKWQFWEEVYQDADTILTFPLYS